MDRKTNHRGHKNFKQVNPSHEMHLKTELGHHLCRQGIVIQYWSPEGGRVTEKHYHPNEKNRIPANAITICPKCNRRLLPFMGWYDINERILTPEYL